MVLTESQLHKIKHALGISHDHNGNYTIPKKIYRPKLQAYRNYYQIKQCDDWDDLVEKGLAVKGESIGLNYYFVTAEGIQYLKDLGYRFNDKTN